MSSKRDDDDDEDEDDIDEVAEGEQGEQGAPTHGFKEVEIREQDRYIVQIEHSKLIT